MRRVCGVSVSPLNRHNGAERNQEGVTRYDPHRSFPALTCRMPAVDANRLIHDKFGGREKPRRRQRGSLSAQRDNLSAAPHLRRSLAAGRNRKAFGIKVEQTRPNGSLLPRPCSSFSSRRRISMNSSQAGPSGVSGGLRSRALMLHLLCCRLQRAKSPSPPRSQSAARAPAAVRS